jgi:hypothetical protein
MMGAHGLTDIVAPIVKKPSLFNFGFFIKGVVCPHELAALKLL